jgi:hypothetical protein
MPYRILTLCVGVVLLLSTMVHAEDHSTLTVAWLDNNTTMIWHEGDAAPHSLAINLTAGSPQQLLLSADAQYVAVNVNTPGSLWLADTTDTNLTNIVPNTVLPKPDGDTKFANISNLQRGANNTFYFTTLDQPSHYTFPNHDLWLVDAAAHTYTQIMPSPQAGMFAVSPDKQQIAIVQSGTYGAVDGKISLVDKSGQHRQDVMTYSAVSSGSDNDFNLQTFWQADSSGFNVAIPNKDLVYNDNTAITDLWHIGSDDSKTQLGSVQATIFGLPQWSDDGKYITYLRHQGDISTNQFELIIAAGDGSNPISYASGVAGAIGVPQWLPNSDQFIYAQGEPGDYWLGQSGQPPRKLPEKVFNPQFVDSTTYVFASAPGDTFDLRYTQLGDATSTLIATAHGYAPVFDAVEAP